ncbi:protein of unknown function [Ectopseudomonas oleovorans]|nr:protein of unknown function [Pseudomonas oleovorans]
MGRKKPALLTSTSTWPNASMPASINWRAACGRAISPATPTKPAGLPSCALACSSRSALRALPTTLNPWARKALARPKPMPLEAPVITTVLLLLMSFLPLRRRPGRRWENYIFAMKADKYDLNNFS